MMQPFLDASYPCYWLGKDGSFTLNEAAAKALPPLNDETMMRRMLMEASATIARKDEPDARAVPFLTSALDVQELCVFPLEDGCLATVVNRNSLPTQVFSSQLREPLTNILSALPMIAKRLESEDVRYAEEVRDNSYAILRLANNIEASSLLAKDRARQQNVDLRALVDSMVFCASSICRGQNVEITADLPEGPVCVLTNVRLFSEAVLNLIRNSLQFTRDGNSIHIRLHTMGNRAVLSIEDQGMGIKPEHLPHIFEPYYSVDPYGDQDMRPGVGLGLSLIRSLTHRLGGTVTAESSFGAGTCITLSVPLSQEEGDMLNSDPVDYLMNRYSPVYVQLFGFCRLPAL